MQLNTAPNVVNFMLALLISSPHLTFVFVRCEGSICGILWVKKCHLTLATIKCDLLL